MNLTQLYTKIAVQADTPGTKINVAEVSRVCRLLLHELVKMPLRELAELVRRFMKREKKA